MQIEEITVCVGRRRTAVGGVGRRILELYLVTEAPGNGLDWQYKRFNIYRPDGTLKEQRIFRMDQIVGRKLWEIDPRAEAINRGALG